MDTSMAFKTWEMSNNMETINSVDEIFKYDRQQQQEILQAKPWQKEWVPLWSNWNCHGFCVKSFSVWKILCILGHLTIAKNLECSFLCLDSKKKVHGIHV